MMRQFKLAICSTFQDFFFSVLFALEILVRKTLLGHFDLLKTAKVCDLFSSSVLYFCCNCSIDLRHHAEHKIFSGHIFVMHLSALSLGHKANL